MTIKLNARLSAYSKVDSFDRSRLITEEQIDSLFVGSSGSRTNSQVDNVSTFRKPSENSNADVYSTIDSLFT